MRRFLAVAAALALAAAPSVAQTNSGFSFSFPVQTTTTLKLALVVNGSPYDLNSYLASGGSAMFQMVWATGSGTVHIVNASSIGVTTGDPTNVASIVITSSQVSDTAKWVATFVAGNQTWTGTVLTLPFGSAASATTNGVVTAAVPPAATATTVGGVVLSGDLSGTASSPQVVSAHLAAPLPQGQGGSGAATLGEATVTPTGASTARPLANKLGDTVSVKDFGAVGDGVTDDTAAVAAACAATTSNTLLFPAGTYAITADTTCGAGTVRLEGGAQFKITAGKTFTASGRVISLGGDPTTGTGTIAYGKTGNLFANDFGFGMGTVPSSNNDDFLHIQHDYDGNFGMLIKNLFDGATTDGFIHIWGGPLSGGSQGSDMRLSAQSNAAGRLVNIVAGNAISFNLLSSSTTGTVNVYAGNTKQFTVLPVTTAVNQITVKGGAAGSAPVIGVQGSDSNIGISYITNGSGIHLFRTGAGTPSNQVEITHTAGATNILNLTGSNGGAPSISTTGGNLSLTSATNIVSAPSLSVTSTTGGGTITLSTGTGTATVNSGARCVCTDTTANASVKCAVAATTLTATGTGSDVIAYLCF